MALKDSVRNKLIEDCGLFYESYRTLNEIAIKKYNGSLFDRIKKYYGNLKKMRGKVEDLPPDNGARIWTFNSEVLNSPDFPAKIDWQKIKDVPLKQVFLRDSLLEFLCVDEHDTEGSLSKEGIASFYLPMFDRQVLIIDDKHRGEEFNKSNYAFTKYKKELRGMIKKYKNPIVLELYDENISEEDIVLQLGKNGVSLHSEFNFLSVDPPTTKHLGYSVMKYSDGDVRIIDSDTHLIDNTFTRPTQIRKMASFIESTLKHHNCKYFVSESAFGFGMANVRTLLSENVGIFQYLSELYGIPFIAISPKRFKTYVLGDGKADKEKTIKWAKKRFKLKKVVQEHEADAIAIAIAFLTDRELLDLCDWK